MSVEFNLPDIGEGLHEAEVVNWLVAVGDTVERNQPFVEIMTDKSTVEMPAPAAGTISRLGVAEGEIVQVGELLVIIDDGREGGESPVPETDDAQVPTSTSTGAASKTAPASASVASAQAHAVGGRPKASPSTRKLAAELGLDLATVAGTGPGGRILADDVRAASGRAGPIEGNGAGRGATKPSTDYPAPTHRTTIRPSHAVPNATTAMLAPGVHPLRGVRRATAKAMDESWSTIPHISAMNEINAEHLLSTRAQLRALRDGDAPSITPLVICLMAVARALRRHPVMNATLDLDAETITVHDRVNLGVAVATDYGLMVPVIADADRLDVFAMASELGRLTTATRAKKIAGADLSGGTYTVTNFGSQGTYVANPIIRPGEAGITGLGAIAERPIVIDGAVVAKPTLPVVVCGDHRLVDGDVMSAFHNDICASLQAPVGLLL